MLTSEEIRLLLESLAWRTVWTDDRRMRLQERVSGYSDDAKIGKIEAMLSVMLEVASNRERHG